MALCGIYGSHTIDACPFNNLEVAKAFVPFAESDPTPLLRKHGITDVVGQYHSAFEHTCVPLKTLAGGVLPRVKAVHGL